MKKKKLQAGGAAKPVARLPQLRPGMPAPDTVEEVSEFVSPQGDKYKILKTTETDAYDPPLPTKKQRLRPSK